MILISNVITETIKYFLPVILMVVAGVVFILCTLYFIKILRQQYKLYNSIKLVGLKKPFLFFTVIAAFIAVLMVYSIVMAISPDESIIDTLMRIYSLDMTLIRLVFIALSILLASIEILMIQMIFSKAAIVDRGIYLGNTFIDWHHIYDYYVDEKKNCIILSRNKRGPLTIHGTSAVFRFNNKDIEKIKFILNKNKNKFIPRYELR